MKGVLVDTCVISEATKKSPNRRVLDFLCKIDNAYISVVTATEIYNGLNRITSNNRFRWMLRGHLEETKEVYPVLPVTPEIERIKDKWKKLRPARADGLIAATAIYHKLYLITRNTEDFKKLGVTIINPWKL